MSIYKEKNYDKNIFLHIGSQFDFEEVKQVNNINKMHYFGYICINSIFVINYKNANLLYKEYLNHTLGLTLSTPGRLDFISD